MGTLREDVTNVAVDWADAHHLPWYHGGTTRVEDLILACRYHHVHEGQWQIRLDPTTGEVKVTGPTAHPTRSDHPSPGPPPTARRDDLPDAA